MAEFNAKTLARINSQFLDTSNLDFAALLTQGSYSEGDRNNIVKHLLRLNYRALPLALRCIVQSTEFMHFDMIIERVIPLFRGFLDMSQSEYIKIEYLKAFKYIFLLAFQVDLISFLTF